MRKNALINSRLDFESNLEWSGGLLRQPKGFLAVTGEVRVTSSYFIVHSS